MSSKEKPFGVAVTTEDEAKNFVQESNQGYYRTYQELKIFKDKDKGIQWKFTTNNFYFKAKIYKGISFDLIYLLKIVGNIFFTFNSRFKIRKH